MPKGKKIVIENYPSRKVYKLNQKILTYFFFVILAALFWLLNSLNNTFTTFIRFPVKYIHSYATKEMVGDKPLYLTLNASGHGYNLLRTIVSAHSHPIVLSIISLNLQPIQQDSYVDVKKFYVLSKSLKEKIQQQLNLEITVNEVFPDTLNFQFSSLVQKKVPVKAILSLNFEQQYRQAGRIIIKPDSIMVTGPKNMLDTLLYVTAAELHFEKIAHSFRTEIKFVPIEKIYFICRKAQLIVPVEEFTEASTDVPIVAMNLPDNLTLKTFPSKVKVYYTVGLRNFKLVNPRQFLTTVDYYSTMHSINNKIRVSIERHPSFVKVTGVKPKNVDFILEH